MVTLYYCIPTNIYCTDQLIESGIFMYLHSITKCQTVLHNPNSLSEILACMTIASIGALFPGHFYTFTRPGLGMRLDQLGFIRPN